MESLPSMKRSVEKTDPPSKAAEGTPVLKIVDNFSWHLVLIVPEGLQKGWHYNIYLKETGEKVRGKLVELDEEQGVGTFHVGVDLKDLVDLRKVEVQVSTKTYTGKIIPMEAINVDDLSGQGVYVMTSRGKKFIPIEIIYQDGGQAIVEGVKLGDKLIIAKKGFRWRR